MINQPTFQKYPSQHTSSTIWYLHLPIQIDTEYIHTLTHTIPITLGTTNSIILPHIPHKDLILYITTIHTVVPYTPKYRSITATSKRTSDKQANRTKQTMPPSAEILVSSTSPN